jgi:hypothetical protein
MCVSNALGWRLTSDFLCETVCAGCNILLCCCGGGMRGETFDSRLESLSDARQGERANVAFTLLTGMRACADDADWRQCLGLAQYSSCMHTCTLSRSFAKATTHNDKQVLSRPLLPGGAHKRPGKHLQAPAVPANGQVDLLGSL